MLNTRDELLVLARPWLRLLFWVLAAAIIIFAFQMVLPILLWTLGVLQPFLIAMIVAYVFHPIVTFVQKKLHLGRVTGIVVLGLTLAGLLIGVTLWLVPVLYQQTISIWNDLTSYLTNTFPKVITKMLGGLLSPETTTMIQQKYIQLMVQLRNSFNSMLGELGTIRPVAQGGISAFRSLAEALSGGLRVVTIFLVSTGFVIVISIYYLIDMDAFPHIIRKLLPVRNRERIWDILVKADHSVGGFLRGQLIACLIVGVLSSILLFIIGMKQYAILIGCFAGLMHMIPYLGPIAGGTPAILFVLLSQQFTSWKERGIYVLIVLGGFAIIETFDGLVTQPFIVGKRASLHPLAVMLALAVGAHFGLGGMIMAVPAACFARVLWLELFWNKRFDLYPGEALPVESAGPSEMPEGEGSAGGAGGPI